MELVKKSDQEMEALREAHKKRAIEIATKCGFTEKPLSDRAKEACKILEIIFEEATTEIAAMLPGEFRTALCLEHLENACMWAKKSIHAHDLYIANLEKEQASLMKQGENGPDNNEN